jgi:hypothetical protein
MFEYSLYFRLFIPKKGSPYAFAAGAFSAVFLQHFQKIAEVMNYFTNVSKTFAYTADFSARKAASHPLLAGTHPNVNSATFYSCISVN